MEGLELDIVVMFADIRGFTSMAERRLPYDVDSPKTPGDLRPSLETLPVGSADAPAA